MTPQETIRDLVDYLNVCRDAYYNKNKSIITDEQYDDLFDKLKALEQEFGIIFSNSPTQSVGYETKNELAKVTHDIPLLSLDKTKSYDDVQKFCFEDVLFMHKLDGLTVELIYIDGDLKQASTRGNGTVGEDITHNARTFIGVPSTIPYTGERRIIGEAIITKKDFEYINSTIDPENRFKTPRNLASGSVRQLDSSICAKRKVRFICWNANSLSETGSMNDGLNNADKCGFITVHRYFSPKNKSDLGENNSVLGEKLQTTFTNMRKRAEVDSIPIDGIVIMYDDIEFGKSLGTTSHHPKNGIAFKFYEDEYDTILRDIEFTIGKTGVITPTAVFDPVDIDGTDVQRASVHNISILRELNLCKGDSITVYKANEIIPQIKRNNTNHLDKDQYKDIVPKHCPYCGYTAARVYSENSGKQVIVLQCQNDKCKGRLLKKIAFFASKPAMNIDGLSEKTLEKFIEAGFINNYTDVYTLIKEHKDDILSMEGFSDRSVKLLNDSIEASKQTTLDRLITALSIGDIGGQTAKLIANYFENNPQGILDTFGMGTYVSLSDIKGIGSQLSLNVNKWFKNKDNFEQFEQLVQLLSISTGTKKTSSKLSGLKFVITGSTNIYKNRAELSDYITSNGGEVSSSVSSSTSYLINNDVNSKSGKNKKAKELNIPIISEQEFVDKFTTGAVETSTDQPKKQTAKRKLF